LALAELIFYARLYPWLFREAREKLDIFSFYLSCGSIEESDPIFFSNSSSCLKKEGLGLI
jgi:hypothetical protein